jgi:hypothetical protein
MNRKWTVRLSQLFKNQYAQKFTSVFKDESEMDSWVETWSALECDVDSMKAALARLPTEFPEWPPTFGQFKALLNNQSKPYVALPAPIKTQPSPEQAEQLENFIKAKAKTGLQWWIPDRVRNQQQVDFIILQANHFGENSQANHFLQDCRAAGVITGNNIST